MGSRPRIKNVIGRRHWGPIRAAWLATPLSVAKVGTPPNPGLADLPPFLDIRLGSADRALFEDVEGLRLNILAEAVFLFHKCAHTHLGAQRIGARGMHSWSLFNAYHSAYLGARGIMALLGISLPTRHDGQYLVDIFPLPESGRAQRDYAAGRHTFDEFFLVRFGANFDQRELWEMFQRTLNAADVDSLDERACRELLRPDHSAFSSRRNAMLYNAAHWPCDDLIADAALSSFVGFAGSGPPPDYLEAAHPGFLLRLSFNVYRLFEALVKDLAKDSAPVRLELEASRIVNDQANADLTVYNDFVASVT